MAAGATYTPIATTTLGSTAASVTFNSFSGYTDLYLVISGKSSTTTFTPRLTFNSDTGTNYSATSLYGNGSSASSARYTSKTGIFLGNYAGNLTEFSPFLTNIQNYSNSTTYKTTLSRGANVASGGDTDATVGLWRSTSAITSMTIDLDSGGSWAIGSTFTLYGIKAG